MAKSQLKVDIIEQKISESIDSELCGDDHIEMENEIGQLKVATQMQFWLRDHSDNT